MSPGKRPIIRRTALSGSFQRVQPALAFAAANLDRGLSLAVLSARTGLSAFHLHRTFSAVAGETPKRFMQRLRLSRGAAMLLTSHESVLDIALSCGFQSHEGFTRAFSRHFGMPPQAYRERGFAENVDAAGAAMHAASIQRISRCVGLFHMPFVPSQRSDMTYSIVKKDLEPQRVLLARRRVKRSEIAATIGAVLTDVFQYAQQHGRAIAGHPFTRYIEFGAGLVTLEPGMKIVESAPSAAPNSASSTAVAATDTVVEEVLPGGPVMTTIHVGPYDTLPDAYAALESWMDSHEIKRAGAPWEYYITDPADVPDPKDWKTEIFWPIV